MPKDKRITALEQRNLIQITSLFRYEYEDIIRREWLRDDKIDLNNIAKNSLKHRNKAKDKFFEKLVQDRLMMMKTKVKLNEKDLAAYFSKPLENVDAITVRIEHSSKSKAEANPGNQIVVGDLVLYSAALSSLTNVSKLFSGKVPSGRKLDDPMTLIERKKLDQEVMSSEILQSKCDHFIEILRKSQENKPVDYNEEEGDALKKLLSRKDLKYADIRGLLKKEKGSEDDSEYKELMQESERFDIEFVDQIDFIIGHELGHLSLGHLGNKKEVFDCESVKRMETDADAFSIMIVRPTSGLFTASYKPPVKKKKEYTGNKVFDFFILFDNMFSDIGTGVVAGIVALSHLFDGPESGVQVFMSDTFKMAGFKDGDTCSYDTFSQRIGKVQEIDLSLQKTASQ